MITPTSASGRKITVVCLGNELARDDRVGLEVGRRLRELPLPPAVHVELRREVGFDLLEDLETSEHVVLVDATSLGGVPGSCRILGEAELAVSAATPFSSHSLPLGELLALGRRLFGNEQVARVTFVGIEAESLAPYHVGLSPRVAAALPGAVARVAELVQALARSGPSTR